MSTYIHPDGLTRPPHIFSEDSVVRNSGNYSRHLEQSNIIQQKILHPVPLKVMKFIEIYLYADKSL